MIAGAFGAGLPVHTNNNKNGRLLARKANRVKTRSNTTRQTVDSNVVAMMAPMRASKMTHPALVVDTIRLTKRVQISLPTPATGSAIISPAILMTGVPGGVTYWRNCRIERIDIFSNSAPASLDTITVTSAGNDSNGQTIAQWIDTGTPGQERAHVGYRLGLLERARWWNTADNTPLGAVSVDKGPNLVVVQAVVELESNFIT
jgi:hypothetical protein